MERKKKSFSGSIEKTLSRSPAEAFISGLQEQKADVKPELEQKVIAPEKPEKALKPKEEKRTVRVNVVMNQRQREKLKGIAIVRNITFNELLNRLIDKEIEASAEDLAKWEKIRKEIGQ